MQSPFFPRSLARRMDARSWFARMILSAALLLGSGSEFWAAPPKKDNSDDMWVAAVEGVKLPQNVTHHTLESPSMKRMVGYCVYLPPGYSEHPDRRYPVIYHLHGAGGNELRTLYSAEVLHEGILRGKWPEMIVVFPNGGRATMYQDSGDGRYMAETLIVRELIPHIDATYRTIADRKARCIEGFSMGGRGSTHLAMRYPEFFGSLFNQSGNVYHVSDVSKAPNPYLGSDPVRLQANDPYLNLQKNLEFIRANLRIQVACGTADPEHIVTVREYHQALLAAGIEHAYFEAEGVAHVQKDLIATRKETWFNFHTESLRRNQVGLFFRSPPAAP
jgi:S-formylglutathione hydrolase FrmB